MNDLVQVTFNYSLVTEEQANQLQTIYNRVLIRHMSTAYEDGKDMLEAKNIKNLPYEDFIAWAHSMFGWSEGAINNKINVALNWGITPAAGVIEDQAMYVLSTKRVPESARQEAKELLASGKDIDEETARQIRDAHREKEKAQEEVKRAHEQLWQTQEISQKRSEQLNEQLTRLMLEIEVLTAKKSIGISPEAQEKINKLTEQRDNLARESEKLSAIAREAALKDQERVNEDRIRKQWRTTCTEFNRSVLKVLSQFPTTMNTQLFEAEDWNYLHQAKETARRFLEECNTLSNKSMGMIIDAG